MPYMNVSIETIAETVKHMSKKDLEVLTLLLSDDGKNLLKRKRDIETGKVKPLSRDEVFNV